MIADLTGKTSGLTLSDSAQIVTGISGNAVYLPDFSYGYVQLSGTHALLSIAFWRLWDGVVNTGAMRSVLGCGTDFFLEFDPADNYLQVKLPGLAVQKLTLMDDQINHHWAITYEQNKSCVIYIDGTAVSTLTAPDAPIDFTPDVFCIGSATGGAHATFDELRMYNSVLKKSDIDGLVQLISKGYLASSMQAVVISTTPKYAGTVQTVPTTSAVVIIKGPVIGNVSVNQGDTVLMTASGTAWKQGYLYKWTGTAWIELTDQLAFKEEYQKALADILSIEGYTVPAGSFGLLMASQLSALQANIDELTTRIIHLQTRAKIIAGEGNFGNDNTPIFLGYDADGKAKFSLGDNLKFDGTNLELAGTVTATAGRFSAGLGEVKDQSWTGATYLEYYPEAGSGILIIGHKEPITGYTSTPYVDAWILYSVNASHGFSGGQSTTTTFIEYAVLKVYGGVTDCTYEFDDAMYHIVNHGIKVTPLRRNPTASITSIAYVRVLKLD